MKDTFKEAYLWHLERHKTRPVDLCKATGVSRDALNKLKKDGPRTTSVENALLVAAFYGKTLEQFMRCEDVSEADQVHNLAQLLKPSERQVAVAMIQALLRARGE